MYTIIISFISVTVSVMSFLFVILQTTKSWYVNIVTKQRIEWAENVRMAINEYIEAYYDNKNLQLYEKKILLYLNSEHTNANKEHIKFVKTLKAVTEGQAQNIDDLIMSSQLLLNWNWREIKKESATVFRSNNVPKLK